MALLNIMGYNFSKTIFLLSFFAIILCLNCWAATDKKLQTTIRHANSYSIRSVSDGYCLTSTRHTFNLDNGIYVGEVLTSECLNKITHQFWDVIHWENTPENQFWLFPKSGALNELTIVPEIESMSPPMNTIEILYLPQNRFLIRSIKLNKCVESHGLDFRISYELCNPELKEQQWTADQFKSGEDRDFYNSC